MPPKKTRLSLHTKNKQSVAHRRRAEERRRRNEDQAYPTLPLSISSPAGEEGIQADHEDVEDDDVCAPSTSSARVEDETLAKPAETDTLGMQKNPVGTAEKCTQALVEMDDKGVQTQIESRATANIGTQTLKFDFQFCGSEIAFLKELGKQLEVHCPKKWLVQCQEEKLTLCMLHTRTTVQVLKAVIVSLGQKVEITVLGHALKNNHPLWDLLEEEPRQFQNFVSGLFRVLKEIDSLNVCVGCSNVRCKEVWENGIFATRGFLEKNYITGEDAYRSRGCELLSQKEVCLACSSERINMVREVNRHKKRAQKSKDLSKVNIKFLAKPDLLNALRDARQLNSKYKKHIKILQAKVDALIEKQEEFVSEKWSDDFVNVNKSNFEKMTPIQKLFWDQQLKAASLKKKSSIKWHPMMIRLALHFQMVSTSAYENVRDSGFITMPSKRTLFDYSHAIASREGCQQEFLCDLKKQLEEKCKVDHERFVCLMFDGMHVRSNIVYQKSTGEIIGYVKLNEVETEFNNLQAEWSGNGSRLTVAKEVLAFMVRNISVNDPSQAVKGIVALYTVCDLTAAGLSTRVWDVIYFLETAGIPVIAVVCDGAAINRKFINMHTKEEGADFLHSTTNMAAADLRTLFFIIDPPHLLKTLRNCFSNSYFHKKSRKLWFNEDISWLLIVSYYEARKGKKLRKACINASHVYLNAFSRMKVSFAAQILSKTLAQSIQQDAEKALLDGRNHPPYEATVKFLEVGNTFFDCVNGHNIYSHLRYKNPNLAPYTSTEDERFQSLLAILQYFNEWEVAVQQREGKFSVKERKKMMISEQTISGLKITITSFIGVIKFLLNQGASAICGRRFCQDPLEQAFSTFRLKGGSSNNPDVAQILQSRVSLHMQKQAALPSKKGNTSVETEQIEIDDTPLVKRQKK